MSHPDSSTAQHPTPPSTTQPDWYKDALIYQLHVKSFYDGNDDGIGDFTGLISKLDYIAGLGVNTLWLLPFNPSPLRDDGYDVADYYGVNPDYGTLAQVRRFIDEAHRRGLRVISELVINHTSDQHPWFQRAREAPAGSDERDWYVWSTTKETYQGTRIIFSDTETSNWTWDETAGAYYWHRFYSHQPDLNFDNPAVLEAVVKVLHYWLELGIDGLRLDAIPYLVEREGTNNENLPETHAVLKRLRAEIDNRFPDRFLLAEANQWPENALEFFGDGDECHMAFHFPLMPRMYIAIAQEDRFPIVDILKQTPPIPENCQWAIFLRNHDELTLELVTDQERDYLWQEYARETRARLNLGIRRRLAPLLQRDRRRIELMTSLLFSMPGTPVIYYGDEIGMGDNIYLGDRDGVRTPMQWSPDRNGGFSRADPSQMVLPPIMDPLYGFGAVNVEAQSRDPHSLLNWTRQMIHIRKRFQAFGRGEMTILYPSNRRILAFIRRHSVADGQEQILLCVANMANSAQAVELDLSAYQDSVPLELLGGSRFPPIGELPYLLTLSPYGFYWFLLSTETQLPDWYVAPPEPLPELTTFVVTRSPDDVFSSPHIDTLLQDILPAYLAKRRWFLARVADIRSISLQNWTALSNESDSRLYLTDFTVDLGHREITVHLPLTVCYEGENIPALAHQLAVSRIRHGYQVGYLTDAISMPTFSQELLQAFFNDQTKAGFENMLSFVKTSGFAHLPTTLADAETRALNPEAPHSGLVVGDAVVLKVIRCPLTTPKEQSIPPELVVADYLTRENFAYLPQLCGYLLHTPSPDSHRAIAYLQTYIDNQGNAATWSQAHLNHTLRDLEGANSDLTDLQDELDRYGKDVVATLAPVFRRLGLRLGEMHSLLANPSSDSPLSPNRITDEHVQTWYRDATCKLEAAERTLSNQRTNNRGALQHYDQLLERSNWLRRQLSRLAQEAVGSLEMCIHGNATLTNILIAQDEVFFRGFRDVYLDGAEYLYKASPAKDLASLYLSIETTFNDIGITFGELAEEPRRSGRLQQMCIDTCWHQVWRGYLETASAIDHHWKDQHNLSSLVDFFALDILMNRIAEISPGTNSPDLESTVMSMTGIVQRLFRD